jgi:hypothetical protein
MAANPAMRVTFYCQHHADFPFSCGVFDSFCRVWMDENSLEKKARN